MKEIYIVNHRFGAVGLRLIGLGPRLIPVNGLRKLKLLFDENTFWARNRNKKDIKVMLANSNVAVSLWCHKDLIGFGRACSDNSFRAVLWDVVINNKYQGKGYGRLIIKTLLESKKLKNVENIYLMTTNCFEFYEAVGFKKDSQKILMVKNK
tara:strand:- start:2182 stop:2637 length:456 start_codon:yes stop_codon:yes gene_type:complete